MKTTIAFLCMPGILLPAFAHAKLTERQQQIIDEARPEAAPHFGGTRVVGVHPNTPLFFALEASGRPPLAFSAANLPSGISLDPRTGILSGILTQKGEASFTATVTNAAGSASEKFRIKCGDTLALTPPMGWNSYDAFGDNVVESEILANARYMAEKMKPWGWDTVVVDYRWYDPGAKDNNPNARANAELAMDKAGRLLPAPNRFPSAVGGAGFKPLADAVHAMGLRFGIHVMRGIPRNSARANLPIEGSGFTAADAADPGDTCVWCPDMFGVRNNAAGQAWYDSCARLWASWGVDFIKVDDLSSPFRSEEIKMIRGAIDRSGCSIVFSTSPGQTPVAEAARVAANANLWRVSEDFWDDWGSLKQEFALAARWEAYVGPGHWPDADMLPVGHLSIQHRSVGSNRLTRLTPDEQITLLSFWSLLPSPLMVGANLPDNDAWTLALLTNPEVLAVNQDPLGAGAKQVSTTNGVETWVKPLADGSRAVGIFNRGPMEDYDESLALYRSPLINHQTPGKSVDIDLDITGATKLWLLVDDGGDGTGYDHADWLNPRLSGPRGDIKLTQLKWVSATAQAGPVALNRSTANTPLIVDGKEYTDGIGTHSVSLIEYTLPPGYTRFTTRAGLDRSAFSQAASIASVHFLVFTRDPRTTTVKASVTLDWSQIGLPGLRLVRDLWLRKNLGRMERLPVEIPPHGCLLLKVK